MPQSEQIIELVKALVAVQAEMPHAKKEASNPFFKSKYADLATIFDVAKPLLSKNGLTMVQFPVECEGNKVALKSLLLHVSGQWLDCGTIIMQPVDTKPQTVGSCITYGRRYSFQSILLLASEDDDGAAASGTVNKPAMAERPVSSGADKPFAAKMGNFSIPITGGV